MNATSLWQETTILRHLPLLEIKQAQQEHLLIDAFDVIIRVEGSIYKRDTHTKVTTYSFGDHIAQSTQHDKQTHINGESSPRGGRL